MIKMRELVQQSASSSTELSAAAEQMLKALPQLARTHGPLRSRPRLTSSARVAGNPYNKRRGSESDRSQDLEYLDGAFLEGPETSRWKKIFKSSAFRIGNETYGVRIAAVREIVRVPEITRFKRSRSDRGP